MAMLNLLRLSGLDVGTATRVVEPQVLDVEGTMDVAVAARLRIGVMTLEAFASLLGLRVGIAVRAGVLEIASVGSRGCDCGPE